MRVGGGFAGARGGGGVGDDLATGVAAANVCPGEGGGGGKAEPRRGGLTANVGGAGCRGD